MRELAERDEQTVGVNDGRGDDETGKMEEEDGADPPVTLVSETPQKPLRTHAGGRGHPKTTPVAGVHLFPGSHVARGEKIMARPQGQSLSRPHPYGSFSSGVLLLFFLVRLPVGCI
jgi:hypothetical protein